MNADGSGVTRLTDNHAADGTPPGPPMAGVSRSAPDAPGSGIST